MNFNKGASCVCIPNAGGSFLHQYSLLPHNFNQLIVYPHIRLYPPEIQRVWPVRKYRHHYAGMVGCAELAVYIPAFCISIQQGQSTRFMVGRNYHYSGRKSNTPHENPYSKIHEPSGDGGTAPARSPYRY